MTVFGVVDDGDAAAGDDWDTVSVDGNGGVSVAGVGTFTRFFFFL